MIVREITRRGGETDVRVVDYKTGAVLADTGSRAKQIGSGAGGYWQLSESNGVVGKASKRKAEKLDAQLGVGGRVNYVEVAPQVYRAGFGSAVDKNAWLRAHKRYDLDAGYSSPAPGTWQNSMPREFED
jgi:hypothetical protein